VRQVDGHSAADIDPRMARLVRALGPDAPVLALGARHSAMLPRDGLARPSQAVAGRRLSGRPLLPVSPSPHSPAADRCASPEGDVPALHPRDLRKARTAVVSCAAVSLGTTEVA
jgi:hypothetical protein